MTRFRRWVLLGVAGSSLGLLLAGCSAQTAQNIVNSSNSPLGLNVVRDQHYGPDTRNVLDVYSPPGARNAPVVLFIHGGSWEGGDKNGYASATPRFAHLPRLRSAGDAEVQEAAQSGRLVIEWVD